MGFLNPSQNGVGGEQQYYSTKVEVFAAATAPKTTKGGVAPILVLSCTNKLEVTAAKAIICRNPMSKAIKALHRHIIDSCSGFQVKSPCWSFLGPYDVAP